MNENNTQCLFIGASLSNRSLRALATAASELRARSGSSDLELRWMPPARYHVTLKYIGWTKTALLPAIVDTVAKAIAGHRSFQFRCQNFGAFPNMESAEVLWAGIDERMGKFAALAKALDEGLADLGIPRETRDFVPHVTIARLPGGGDLKSLTKEAPEHVFSKSSLEDLILYKSSVESDASEYKKIARWALE